MEKDLGNVKSYINLDVDEFEKFIDFMETAIASNLEVFYGGSVTIANSKSSVVALKDSNYINFTNGLLVKAIKSDTQEIPFCFAIPSHLLRSLINAAMGGDQSNQSQEFDEFDLSTGGEILSQAFNTFGSSVSLDCGKPISAYTCEVVPLDNYAVLLKNIGGIKSEEMIIQVEFPLDIECFSTYNCAVYINLAYFRTFCDENVKREAPAPQPAPAPTPVPTPTPSISEVAPDPLYQQSASAPTTNTVYTESNTMFRAPLTKASMDLLMNIPLEISIQIGQTKRKVREICEFTNGTVIEIDKPISQPVDVLANNHLIAHGEVVVTGDNFGIKITDVIDMKEILANFDGSKVEL